MNKLFHHYLDYFVIIFIDDILVYSSNTGKHTKHLRIVLQTLEDEKLLTKFSKCVFWPNQVLFLRHIISSERLKVDLQKVEVIETWERLRMVRSFLGMAGYYSRFIEGFFKLALPLTTLSKKATKFEWLHGCERSFQELKCRLIFAPILVLPMFGKEYEVFCDTSHQG